MAKISFGIDIFLQKKQAKHKRWGLVTNDAVLTTDFMPVRQALLQAGFNLVCLFSPEHGIEAMGTDGAAMPHKTDKLTRLPIYSLYGDALKPPPSVLEHLDGVLFDLPDIGVRFYTYIWTLSHMMEACNAARIPLFVLDRPNPISGKTDLIEAPILDESGCSSFIGRWAIPVRHSMTVGELALFWQHEKGFKDLDLRIIPAKGWRRDMFFQDLTGSFVPPSPAIPSLDTLLTYPALCFMEGLNVSEGRGTAFPFRVCGAPFIDGFALADAFNKASLAGVKARPFSFTPSEGMYQHQLCRGIMLHVIDRAVFKPVYAGLYLTALLKAYYPSQIEWANYPTHVNKTGARHFDLLTGTPSIREALEKDSFTDFCSKIEAFTASKDWSVRAKTFYIYT